MINDITLRRCPGLPGTDHQADDAVTEFTANELDKVQARIVGFHHDIDQRQGDIRIGGQQGLCLFC